jgi:hypothetical protein
MQLLAIHLVIASAKKKNRIDKPLDLADVLSRKMLLLGILA